MFVLLNCSDASIIKIMMSRTVFFFSQDVQICGLARGPTSM